MNESYQLRSRYVMVEKNQDVIQIFGGSSVFDLTVGNDLVKKWILSLREGASTSELLNLLSKDEIDTLISKLKSKELLRSIYSNDFSGTAYEKQIPFFSEYVENPNLMQKELFKKHIVVVGVGGVGSIVLKHLIALGVRKFTLVDFDTIQLNNLNRQFLFDYNDTGKSKILITKEKLERIDPSVEVDLLDMKVEDSETLISKINKDIDLVVCAADTPPIIIRKELLKVCVFKKCPIAFASVGLETGSWGPFFQNIDKMEHYLKHLSKLEEMFDGKKMNSIPMSIGYSNTLISTFLSMDITRYFLGQNVHSLNKKMQIDFDTLKISVREELG